MRLMEHIPIVENSFRRGVGRHIARLFRSENDPKLDSLVIDNDEIDATLASYKPDVVI